ncbi:MAG: hypothetical protein IT480_18360, partial [Gammaproteobacteria bacterium]|nr:hypothetical protein [Gammaproteobacteria bacterium]
MARLLAPESASLEVVSQETGIGRETLSKWLAASQSMPARGRAWTAGARLEALIATAAMSEADKSAWCREKGVYVADLKRWRAEATAALAQPAEARASPQATREDRKRIRELEREVRRKDRALAETAALLVLSKKQLKRRAASPVKETPRDPLQWRGKGQRPSRFWWPTPSKNMV